MPRVAGWPLASALLVSGKLPCITNIQLTEDMTEFFLADFKERCVTSDVNLPNYVQSGDYQITSIHLTAVSERLSPCACSTPLPTCLAALAPDGLRALRLAAVRVAPLTLCRWVWWDSVVMMRKLAVAIIVTFVDGPTTAGVQLLLVVCILVVALVSRGEHKDRDTAASEGCT